MEKSIEIGKLLHIHNNIGFEKTDFIMSSIANFYKEKGFLTPKQISLVKTTIIKYDKQLKNVNILPLPVSRETTSSTSSSLSTQINEQKTTLFLSIQFPYGDERFKQIINKVKQLNNRTWDSTSKRWAVPITHANIEMLEKIGFPIPQELLEKYSPIKQEQEFFGELKPKTTWTCNLRPYQKAGVLFAEKTNGNCLIGDDMGLGKTAQALGFLAIKPEIRPAIVICPASVKYFWADRISEWLPNEKIEVLLGRKPAKLLQETTIAVINYDILKYWENEILNCKIIIGDEIQMIKNMKAARTKSFMRIAKHIQKTIALSGTPIENRTIEFFPILHCLRSDLFPNFFKFAQNYTDAKKTRFGWEFNGSKNWIQLNDILKKYIMIRRMKNEVLKELPPKTRTIIPIVLENQPAYRKAIVKFKDWKKWAIAEEQKTGKKVSMAAAMVQFELLKQAAFEDKKEQVIEWVKEHLEENKKIVLFCTHKEAIEYLKNELSTYNPVIIDGSIETEKRNEIVNKFQNDDSIKVFIGNIKAAGAGITLTASNAVGIVELPWNPKIMEQAEDRINRIGQEADSITAFYFVAKNTVEEKIIKLLEEKKQEVDKILNGEDTINENLINQLLKGDF